ncbi:MAG: sulfur transferase domain-containing protein [Woeseiaceae bacterium]
MRLDLTTRHQSFVLVGTFLLVLATSAVADGDRAAWKYRFEPADGITAAGQPNENGLRELADSGYAAVIDLRTEGEDRGLDEKAVVESLGMDYVSLPIEGRGAISFENAAKLDQILGKYDQPVLVHCGSSNRVGALFALREKMNGADDEDALAFGKSAGMTSLEDTVKSRLAED